MKSKINWDAWGIAASLACAIHCAVLPLFLASLPLFGADIVENKAVEITMILLALAIGSYGLRHGYLEHHHRKLPLVLFVAGMLLLVFKELWHDWHLYLLLPAVSLIVLAHYLNFRYCRHHEGVHKEDCHHDHY
ncbi:MerC domain-containing protein [Niabella terrae]